MRTAYIALAVLTVTLAGDVCLGGVIKQEDATDVDVLVEDNTPVPVTERVDVREVSSNDSSDSAESNAVQSSEDESQDSPINDSSKSSSEIQHKETTTDYLSSRRLLLLKGDER